MVDPGRSCRLMATDMRSDSAQPSAGPLPPQAYAAAPEPRHRQCPYCRAADTDKPRSIQVPVRKKAVPERLTGRHRPKVRPKKAAPAKQRTRDTRHQKHRDTFLKTGYAGMLAKHQQKIIRKLFMRHHEHDNAQHRSCHEQQQKQQQTPIFSEKFPAMAGP